MEKSETIKLLWAIGVGLIRLEQKGTEATRAEIIAVYDSLWRLFKSAGHRLPQNEKFMQTFDAMIKDIKNRCPDATWLHECIEQLRHALLS